MVFNIALLLHRFIATLLPPLFVYSYFLLLTSVTEIRAPRVSTVHLPNMEGSQYL